MKITSEMRYGKDWRVSYRYYLDGNELWFNFNDVCKVLHIESSKFINNYFNSMPTYNKRIFNDNRDDVGNLKIRYEQGQFINKAAFDEFKAHETERLIMLNNDMEELEVELGLREEGSMYEVKHILSNMVSELSKRESDVSKLRDYTKNLLDNSELQNVISYNPNKEKVQAYQDWLDNEEDEGMFVSFKKYGQVYTYDGPTIDEALDTLFKAGLDWE